MMPDLNLVTMWMNILRCKSFFSLICFFSLDNPYSYHWQQISAPEGSHGYMEGQDSRRVILSQVYNFWKWKNKQANKHRLARNQNIHLMYARESVVVLHVRCTIM